MIELIAPRLPGRDEAAELQVTTGPLPPAARLEFMAEHGESYGAVTPFGPSRDRDGTTATVPIPRSAFIDGKLRLRVRVIEPGAAPRALRSEELKSLNLVVTARNN